MKIFNSLKNLVLEDETAVALGNFDGIHVGHKTILEDAVKSAKEKNIKSLCFTFSNHPINYILNKNDSDMDAVKSICNESEKISIIESIGFDYLVNIPFDDEIMNMSSKKFFDDIIIAALNASIISVGFNYNYGQRAQGNAESLYHDGESVGIEVHVHDAVKIYHNIVSSTLIREAITNGDMELAAMYLGREIAFTDIVRHGDKIGKIIGFPTINIPFDKSRQRPKLGVYSSRTIIDGEEYKSITNIGTKPTFFDNIVNIETHIINYNDNAYGKTVSIIFGKYIRPEYKFDSIETFREQIIVDMRSL